MSQQLTLEVQLQEDLSFDNYCWDNNQELQQQLRLSLKHDSERFFYLWGPSGMGKSHLLQACCHHIDLQAKSALYLPLKSLKSMGPMILENLEDIDLLAIDDIDTIAGNRDWEEALFHLYNKVRDQEHGLLVIAGTASPNQLSLTLPDLRSRLAWGLTFQLHDLSESKKVTTLQRRAQYVGLELGESVAQYLVSRCSRNMSDLIDILDKLDKASLAARRRLTIPFIKQVLAL